MVAITLNPADKGSGLVLSNGNLTASNTSYWYSVRSTQSVGSGKVYQEITVANSGSNYDNIGIANSLADMGNGGGNRYLGWDNNSYSWHSAPGSGIGYVHGGTWYGGATQFYTNDVLMVALDLVNGKLQFGKNGTWNNSGNPVTGANPTFSGIPSGPWFSGLSIFSGSMTVNYGSTALSYSPPAGFQSYQQHQPITVYRSTDTSAPQLTGQAGKLITVLDACLVNGYGTKASLGWTKPYSGTNTASYQMAAGSQSCLGIDDNGGATFRHRGFKTMSAAGTAQASGTNPFPTDAQIVSGLQGWKSGTNDAVIRPQTLISNGTMIYLLLDSGSVGVICLYAFGDMSSYNPTDPNPCLLTGVISDGINRTLQTTALGTACTLSHFLALKYDGVTQSTQFGKLPMKGFHGYYDVGLSTLLQYPDPIVGGVAQSPIYIHEGSAGAAVIRGYLPGIQVPCSNGGTYFNTGDIISGSSGDLTGRTLEVFQSRHNTAIGTMAFETSDTQNLKILR